MKAKVDELVGTFAGVLEKLKLTGAPDVLHSKDFSLVDVQEGSSMAEKHQAHLRRYAELEKRYEQLIEWQSALNEGGLAAQGNEKVTAVVGDAWFLYGATSCLEG